MAVRVKLAAPALPSLGKETQMRPKPGKTNSRRRLSTIDLLIKKACFAKR
jgi:hypothetical protein